MRDTKPVRKALVCFFRRAAQFRESLTAKDTPGDRRNTHYASSLHAIVAYVETLPDDHPTLEMLAQCDPLYDELERTCGGEAMFNLGYYSNYAGGAFACGRCHTTGWSYDEKGPDGNGALGPSLRGDVSTTRFPGPVVGFDQQVEFVCTGSEHGVRYGQNGQGTGRMPGFCQTPAEAPNPAETGEVGVEAREASDPATVGGMYSLEDVQEIVRYVRSL